MVTIRPPLQKAKNDRDHTTMGGKKDLLPSFSFKQSKEGFFHPQEKGVGRFAAWIGFVHLQSEEIEPGILGFERFDREVL